MKSVYECRYAHSFFGKFQRVGLVNESTDVDANFSKFRRAGLVNESTDVYTNSSKNAIAGSSAMNPEQRTAQALGFKAQRFSHV